MNKKEKMGLKQSIRMILNSKKYTNKVLSVFTFQMFMIFCCVFLSIHAYTQDAFKTSSGVPDVPSFTTTLRDAISAETGMIIYNSTEERLEIYDGTQWKALITDAGTGKIAGVTAGNGLSGGGLTGAVTLNLGVLTSDWSQNGAYDIYFANAASELFIKESAGDSYYGVFDVGDLSANRTYTFPNQTGIVAMTADGSLNYIPKYTSTVKLGNSLIYDDGTTIGIGVTPSSGSKLEVNGTVTLTDANDMGVSSSDASLTTKKYVYEQKSIMENIILTETQEKQVDVSGIGVVYVDNSERAVHIFSFANGQDGQILRIVILYDRINTQPSTLKHDNNGVLVTPSLALQPIYTFSGRSITWYNRGGALLICKSNIWYVISSSY